MNNEENAQAQAAENVSQGEENSLVSEKSGSEKNIGGDGKSDSTGTAPSEKTYTEAEVEKLIEKRLKKERASADEKAEEALARITHFENREACFKAGIREDCIDDVITLASKLVGEKTDINKAVAKIAEKYPQFKNSADKLPTTGTRTKDDIGEISDDALRTAFGLAAKK